MYKMKEIVIFTMGSRGDIQPYIYLAQALIKEGYRVILGTHPCWQNLITKANVNFMPIGPNIDIEYESAIIRGKTKNPMLSVLKTMKFVFNIIQNSSYDIYEVCKDKDLVIVSHSQMGATEAEALKLKTINVTLQTEMIPEIKKQKSFWGKLVSSLINSQMVKPYNKIRKCYDLPPIKSMDKVMSPTLNLIPISRYVVQPNPYWEDKNRVVGYWFINDEDYQPSEALKAFLSTGDKPILLALGAMSFESEQEKEKLDLFVKAFENTGMRAIIQGFNKTLADYQLPKTMISIGSVPHSWLFKQGYAVIHHCGFGTSASSMIYGIPSIPIPHVLDQFVFAQHLYKLNVGVSPIRANELSVDKLVSAIERLNANYKAIHHCVTELSEKMIAENGLATATKLIQEVIEEGDTYEIHR